VCVCVQNDSAVCLKVVGCWLLIVCFQMLRQAWPPWRPDLRACESSSLVCVCVCVCVFVVLWLIACMAAVWACVVVGSCVLVGVLMLF